MIKSKILKQKLGIQNACLIEKKIILFPEMYIMDTGKPVQSGRLSTCAGASAAVS